MNLYRVRIEGSSDYVVYMDAYCVVAEDFSMAIEKSKLKMYSNNGVNYVEVKNIELIEKDVIV